MSIKRFLRQICSFGNNYFILEYSWKAIAPKINIAEPTELLVDQDDNDDVESLGGSQIVDQFDEEHLSEIARDQVFMTNLDYMCNEVENDANDVDKMLQPDPTFEAPSGFLSLKRDHEGVLIRKASVLWMLTNKSDETPTNRLHRFQDENKSQNVDHVMCGDFVFMKSSGKKPDQLCQVLGFKFRTGNPTFTAMSCPLKVEK